MKYIYLIIGSTWPDDAILWDPVNGHLILRQPSPVYTCIHTDDNTSASSMSSTSFTPSNNLGKNYAPTDAKARSNEDDSAKKVPLTDAIVVFPHIIGY